MRFEVIYYAKVSDHDKELSLMYWKCHSDVYQDFTYRVKEVAAQYGISQNHVPEIISKTSYVLLPDLRCQHCHIQYKIYMRSHFIPKAKTYLCNKCREIQPYPGKGLTQYRDILKALIPYRAEIVPTLTDSLDANNTRQLANKPSIRHLSIIDKFLLIAVKRAQKQSYVASPWLDRDEYRITHPEDPLGPSADIDKAVIDRLYHANILVPLYHETYRPFDIDAAGSLVIDFGTADFSYNYDWAELTALEETLQSASARRKLLQHPEYSNWLQRILFGEISEHLRHAASQKGFKKLVVDDTMMQTLTVCLSKAPLDVCFFVINEVLTEADKMSRGPMKKKGAIQIIQPLLKAAINAFKPSYGKVLNREVFLFYSCHRVLRKSSLSATMIDLAYNIPNAHIRYSLPDLLSVVEPSIDIGMLYSKFDSHIEYPNHPSWERAISVSSLYKPAITITG